MEQLKHECGVAMIRLLKPLDYYEKKYGTWAYGFNKLYLMMEKQHNRGQEGAGIASVSLNTEPGREYMFREKAEGKDAITEIFSRVTQEMANVLRTTMEHYDGGYVMCGLTGSGEMFSVRDPWGIRPAFYYRDDEIVALASERPVLQTTFDLDRKDIQELQPGQALIVHKNGESRLEQIMPAQQLSACSFERIYFSRGSDCDIYQERKRLGEQLTPAIMKAIDGDVDHTVFSYIPNTAEVAYYGMTDGFRKLHGEVRTEKVVWKDIKMRTFIADNSERNDLAAHVYDISYGSLRPYEDNLVIIDDSIVRGTTLRESIFKILDRLHPKKIVMVSSSPQIRYPDYYGIDMARLEEFCAFRATMALIEERGMWQLVNDVYLACKRSLTPTLPTSLRPEGSNHVRALYEPFTVEEINNKIVEMLRPKGMQAPIELVFQSIEGLHEACPNHPGDWYFTGHYPTPGGTRLCNQAFINYVEKSRK